jgi:single-strand DNA-binding protein
MHTLNRVQLMGHVGKEPELQTTNGGTKYVRLSIATDERWTDKAGKPKSRTNWTPVVFWGDLAATVARDVHKGSHITVDGQLRVGSYKKDGNKQLSVEVRANTFQLHHRAENHQASGEPQPSEDNAL